MISVYLRLSKLRRNLKRVTEFIIMRHHPIRTPMTMPLTQSSRGMNHLGMHGGKPHLGQKPKLGGRYTDIVHSCMHNIWSVLCISIFCFLLIFLFYFYFLKHKKIKKISVVSLVFCFGGFYYCSNLYFYLLFRLCAKSSL